MLLPLTWRKVMAAYVSRLPFVFSVNTIFFFFLFDFFSLSYFRAVSFGPLDWTSCRLGIGSRRTRGIGMAPRGRTLPTGQRGRLIKNEVLKIALGARARAHTASSRLSQPGRARARTHTTHGSPHGNYRPPPGTGSAVRDVNNRNNNNSPGNNNNKKNNSTKTTKQYIQAPIVFCVLQLLFLVGGGGGFGAPVRTHARAPPQSGSLC